VVARAGSVRIEGPGGRAGGICPDRRSGWSCYTTSFGTSAVAVLTLSSVSFVGAQSNPGQPFYRLRLSLEGVQLPFEQPTNPLQSRLDKADARLGDVEREAAAKDWNAAADAASAYGDVVASISLPADAAAKATALQRLDAEVGRLEQLRLTSRAPETAALDKAIAAVCGLLGIAVPTPLASATPPAANQGNGNGRDGNRATSTPSQGRDPDSSGDPKTTPGAGKSGSSGHPGDNHGGNATPTPQDPDGSARSSGGRQDR
jgi:hypothetical protein